MSDGRLRRSGVRGCGVGATAAMQRLPHEAALIKDNLKNIHLPLDITRHLEEGDEQQKQKLNRKLKELCMNSKWRQAGRPELIKNLASTESHTRRRALTGLQI